MRERDDSTPIWLPLLIGAVIGFFIGGLVGRSVESTVWERKTAAQGVALFCPQTGAWAWKGECPTQPEED